MIHNLSMLTFPSAPPPRVAPHRKLLVWFRQALLKLNWLFSNPSNPPRILPVHDVIHIPWSHFSIWDFYFDISEWHILSARTWTPVLMLHLTNPCAKRKVLSLTKPKGKIYKIKSLGHYITIQLSHETIFYLEKKFRMTNEFSILKKTWNYLSWNNLRKWDLTYIRLYLFSSSFLFIYMYGNVQRWKNTRSSEDDFIDRNVLVFGPSSGYVSYKMKWKRWERFKTF